MLFAHQVPIVERGVSLRYQYPSGACLPSLLANDMGVQVFTNCPRWNCRVVNGDLIRADSSIWVFRAWVGLCKLALVVDEGVLQPTLVRGEDADLNAIILSVIRESVRRDWIPKRSVSPYLAVDVADVLERVPPLRILRRIHVGNRIHVLLVD